MYSMKNDSIYTVNVPREDSIQVGGRWGIFIRIVLFLDALSFFGFGLVQLIEMSNLGNPPTGLLLHLLQGHEQTLE